LTVPVCSGSTRSLLPSSGRPRRARLLERGHRLLDAQLVVARVEAGDELAAPDDRPEIDRDGLQAAGDLRPDLCLVVGGEGAVDRDGLPDGHLGDARRLHLPRLARPAPAARPPLLCARRVVALAARGRGEHERAQRGQGPTALPGK